MRVPDPKANTTTEAYLAYKAGYLEESELKPVVYKPYLHFDSWLAYWAGLTGTYPVKNVGKNLWGGTFVLGGIATNNGNNFSASDRVRTVEYTPVQANTTYSLSGVKGSRVAFFYDSAKNYLGYVIVESQQTSGSFTTIAGTAFIRWVVIQTDTDIEEQLELGPTVTAYEPYTGEPEMLTDEEALVAYLAGVTDTYPEDIKDPYDVRIVGYLRHLASIRWPEPDYPVNNEEFYLSTMEPTHTSNSEPSTDIELDTAEGKIIGVEAYGDTYQQTYSGKNLLPMVDGAVSDYGITLTIDKGILTINGTANSAAYFKLTNGVISNPGSTIPASWLNESVTNWNGKTLSIKLLSGTAPSGSSAFRFFTDANSHIWQSYPNITRTATFDTSEDISCFALFVNPDVVFDNAKYEIQLEQGSSATSYEPYVGGIPAPNPDYPQDIQVVTGEQTVMVSGKSKNLFDTSSYTTSGSGLTVTRNEDGSFTVNGTSTANFWIRFTNTIVLDGNYTIATIGDRAPTTAYFNIYEGSDSTGLIAFANAGSSSHYRNFTTTKTSLSQGLNIEPGTYNNFVFRLMLVKGTYDLTTIGDYEPSQSQSYPIDLGSTELCKIDTYVDGIFKNEPTKSWYNPDLEDDAWYVHKAIGKMVLDGSSDEAWTRSSATDIYYRSSTIDVPSTNYALCNYLRVQNVNTSVFNMPNCIRFSGFATDIYINPSSKFATLTDFTTWLGTAQLECYYALATPTDTKITDATLVGQLEALAGADTYNEKTYIKVTATDPNLPALLKVEAYKY